MLSIEQINQPDLATATAIRTLQQAAYARESALISHPIPAQNEAAAAIGTAPDTFLLAYEASELIGALSYEEQSAGVHINRLVVAPAHFRRGVARQLLQHLFAVEAGASAITVSTAAANGPARQLYEQVGFVLDREFMVGENLKLVLLIRKR